MAPAPDPDFPSSSPAHLPVPGLTHLHVHSHYTLLGATPPVAELARLAAAQGMSHLALTDTNALYGAVAFARACAKEGITPLIGMTVTVAQPPEVRDGPWATAGELVLIAAAPAGWRSLCALSSAIQNRPDREEQARRGVDWEALRAHRAGLICLAGGRRSWLGRCLAAGDAAAAGRYASRLGGIYGEDAVLAIELHRPEDHAAANAVVELGKRFGLPVAVAQPVYCLSVEERARLPLLAALAHNCPLAELPPVLLPDEGDAQVDLHWLTPAELAARYAAYPQALAQVGEVARRCVPALPDGRPLWPVLPWAKEQMPDEALRQLAEEGMAERYRSPSPAVVARLEQELAAIARRGYAPLFLLVADIARFARSREIPLNTRGSVANSLVAYCTGITTVDPIAHDLLFERFLNPERAGLPDIDLDLCSRRRDEVLDYVRNAYGAERVALVAAMTTLRPKSAVRETAKAHGLDETEIEALVGRVRDEWHPDPRRRVRDPLEVTLEQVEDPRLRAIVTLAYGLVGTPHHLSVHPGGVVVAPEAVTAVAPLQWTPKGFAVTQFSHEDVAAVGLPKVDLLGIRALTVLADTAALVREHSDASFHLADIPPDDPATGALLAAGETIGVFQCESWGAQRTLRQLQARTVKDLVIANAFFKPGPATGGMAQSFIRRYRGEEPVSHLHPALAPILGRTQGVLLFQEQVLRVAVEMAGLSWGQADRLRRGMSKFQAAEMAALQEAFVQGCLRLPPEGPGLVTHQAETLWNQIMAFAGYGFNQGHATAYADLSYRSAYLKTHWPAEFLCARLADWGGFHHQAVYLAEARRLGILVRPPHVNHSLRHFRLTREETAGKSPQPVLWMGLGQVRDLRRSAIHALLAARRQQPFSSVDDLLARVPLRRKEWTHLVQCGALDGLGENRAALLAAAGGVRAGKRGDEEGARQMAFDFVAQAVAAETLAQRLAWEQRILGLPVSLHPLETLGELPTAATLAQARARPGQLVAVVGTRLPGWTGGKGWFFAGRADYAVAISPKGMAAPRPWRPIRVAGRWQQDQWGDAWLQVERWWSLEGNPREEAD